MGWYNANLAGYNYNPATNQAPKNTDVSLRGYSTAPTPTPWGNSVAPTYKEYVPYIGYVDKKNPNSVNAASTQLKYNPVQYSASDNKNTLSYKVNIGGKDYFYSPASVRLGAGANYGWDPNKVKAMGGVAWNRALGGATSNPNNSNPFSQAQNPTYESGFLFENDPNALGNMGYNEWKDSSWWQDQGLGLAAIAAAPFAVSAMGAGAAPTTSGAVATAPTAAGAPLGGASGLSSLANPVAVGGAQGAGSGVGAGFSGSLAESIPSYAGAGEAFAGAGTGVGNASILPSAAGASGGLGSLSNLWSGWKDMTGLTGAQTGQLGLGIGDLAMRLNQQNQLEDLMNKSADRADALKQPERLPYQQLLSQYMNGGMDITQQPAVKAELDYAMRAAQAQMAKAGITGAGNVGMATADYANEAMQKSALPYLQYLAGLGGFNQGVGSSGNIMATLGGQASGAPFQGMNSLGQAINNISYDTPPWWSSAYNAQQQMMGRGSNSNIYGIS